jgi:putative flavoprotein involved in K+ transport
MKRTDAIIVGGGQAGLAMSRCLADAGIDHIVLERGRIAERWRSERWDSLRLLTPNWQTRLPGFQYAGADADGFMTAGEVASYLEGYATSFNAPVEDDTAVTEVSAAANGYRIVTSRHTWLARSVVIATGYCDVAHVPQVAGGLTPRVRQVVPTAYRRPEDLDTGGVLVVGASATGIQIADELVQSGRAVTIAAGHHTRVPRSYRARDIMWWLDRAGLLDVSADDVYDLEVSRSQPSFQLVGRPDRASIDLAGLQRKGARVAGHLQGIDNAKVWFHDDLVATTAASDAKLAMLLKRLDDFACAAGLDGHVGEAEPFEPIWPGFLDAPAALDLHAEGITTVVWATGYRRRYSWLRLPVLDRRGDIAHTGGVTSSPGVYVLGMQFQRRRNSNFIDGVGKDARYLADEIAAQLAHRQGHARRAIA